MRATDATIIVLEILIGLGISLFFIRLKGLLSLDYMFILVASVILFTIVAPLAFYAGLILSQSTGLAWIVFIAAPFLLLAGLLLKTQISIPFIIVGSVFCTLFLGGLVLSL